MKAKIKKPRYLPRQAHAKSSLTPTLLITAIVVGLAGLVIFAVWQTIQSRAEASRLLEGVEQFPNLPRDHQEGKVTYDRTPPAGGIHNSVWQNCGVYTEPVAAQLIVVTARNRHAMS